MRRKGRVVGTAALSLLMTAAAFCGGGHTAMERLLIQPAYATQMPGDIGETDGGTGTESWDEEPGGGTGAESWDEEPGGGTGAESWDEELGTGTGAESWDGELGTGTESWDETPEDGTGWMEGQEGPGLGPEDADGGSQQSVFYFLVPGKRAFNRETGMYVHYIDSGMKQSFASSVPDGIITNDIVSVEMQEGSTWRLYRDGEELVAPDLKVIEQPGSYVLEVTDGSGINKSRLAFRLVTRVTNAVDTIRLPEGFTFQSILYNGKGISINSLNEHRLSDDGVYEITFGCDAIDRVYTTKIMVDREAPQLALPEVKNGLAAGEVSLEDLNPEDTVMITRDGQPYQLSFMRTITEYGHYTVQVTDPAGNSSLYEFTIQIYLTISSLTAIFLVVGVIGGLVWYAVHVRNHLRVR